MVPNASGFAASAKPNQVRRDVPRVSEEQDVEEEEEEEEEEAQPATTPVRTRILCFSLLTCVASEFIDCKH